MLTENLSEKFIDLKTLSKLLLVSDTRAAHKWCESKNIEVQIIAKKQLVYRFLVDMELDKKLVNDLKKKHPLRYISIALNAKNILAGRKERKKLKMIL